MKTAKEFLSDNESFQFKEFCSKAGIEPTKRQVRKFRLKRGLAYQASLKESYDRTA